MPDLRLRKGDLQAAVHHYYNGQTRRYFVLVGVAHIAEPGFWRSINALAEEFLRIRPSSHEVHYECVANDTGLPHNRLEEHPYSILAGLLGLQMQFPVLDTDKGWINTDMTVSDVIQHSELPGEAWRWLSQNRTPTLPKMSEKRQAQVRVLARILFRYGMPLALHLPAVKQRWLARLIRDGRSDYAMERMLAREKNILAIWGAAHLGRMHRILRRNGYRRLHTEWNTVIARVPKVPVPTNS